MATRRDLAQSSAAQGYVIDGIKINDRKFFALMTLNQLEGYGLLRPTALINSKTQETLEGNARAKAADSAKIRAAVQRGFNKKRRDNAQDYAEYLLILETDKKFMGDAPAINIYSTKDAATVDEFQLVLKFVAQLVAIDGETQVEARFILRETHPESGEWFIPVIIHYGISQEFARQILHDYNQKAMPIKETKLSTFNKMGAVTRVLEAAVEAARFPANKISLIATVPGIKSIITHAQLRAFVVGHMVDQRALEQASATLISALNRKPSGPRMDTAQELLADLLDAIKDDETHPAANAHPHIWQCAGVKGFLQPSDSVRWKAGVRAYDSVRTTGRGGPRTPIKQILAAIYHKI